MTNALVTEPERPVVLENPRLRAPRAAAIAGILFSVLLLTSLVLIRISVPRNPLEPGSWLSTNLWTVRLALNLVPFAGIAFLWFIGVVRDRIGALEDRLFATVFLGSGLLFLAMTFTSAAMAGGLLMVYGATPTGSPGSDVYTLGRAATYEAMNVYAIKMAGVFMISTSTLAIRTRILPRWIGVLGIALALVLLLSIGEIDWVSVLFPLWVLLVSIYILFANMRQAPAALADVAPGPGD